MHQVPSQAVGGHAGHNMTQNREGLHLHAQRPPGVAIPGKRTFGGQVESLGSDARKVSVLVIGSPSCKACSYTVEGIGLGRPGQLSDLSRQP